MRKMVNRVRRLDDHSSLTDVGDKEVSEEELSTTLDINVKGPIICTKLAINCMKRHGIDGHIITVNRCLCYSFMRGICTQRCVYKRRRVWAR